MRSFALIVVLVALCAAGCGKKPTQPNGGTPLNLNSGDLVFTTDFPEKVIRVDPSTGGQSIIASGGDLADPSGVAFAPNGDLYVSDESSFNEQGAIFKFSRATGVRSTIFTDATLVQIGSLTVAPSGDIYFSCYSGTGPGSARGKLTRCVKG